MSAPTKLMLAALVLVVAIALALAFGSEHVSLAAAFAEPDGRDRLLISAARAPRVALAAIAGAGLAIVGVAFQALLRNPLAEPYVLGVSGGSALGASIAIVLGASAQSLLGAATVPLVAFAFGLGATALVYAIARGTPAQSSSMLLAGVIVNALAAALITLLKTVVSAAKAQELLFWLTGFLDVPSNVSLVIVALYVIAGGAVLALEAGNMNLLALGDEPAQHLGVDVKRTERRVFFAASAIVGAIVSVTGLIGFVGLVVPHALRRLVGPDHRVLMPMAALGGAAALVLCDLGARLLFHFAGTEPPVGAITALIGGPLFLALIANKRA